jgi:hypothetical protein
MYTTARTVRAILAAGPAAALELAAESFGDRRQPFRQSIVNATLPRLPAGRIEGLPLV